jgi:hypothetical protein
MTLHYNLHYNFALVSVKTFHAARPIIPGHDWLDRSRDNLLAIGCCFNSGTLMAASGKPTSWSGKLDCKFLAYSTCQITKILLFCLFYFFPFFALFASEYNYLLYLD